jgi:demethylmenaquinone methyltransferase/2-methoxy-6-polyprenyl-1,4-benzoquinol methylase
LRQLHSSTPRADRVRGFYERVAGQYDRGIELYALLGYRAGAYRRRAVQVLGVRPGQTVVDIGCGTGKNLSLLADAVGPKGHVVGVDFSASMLEQARTLTDRHRLANVDLVEADAATFVFPDGLDRVIATFSLSMMPEPGVVIARAAMALPLDGRLAVLDFRIPEAWPVAVRRSALALAAPLGETWAMAERDLREPMRQHLDLDTDEAYYFGAAYVAAGTPVP